VRHRGADRRRAGLSVRSSSFYLQAIRQFCRWLVADRRAAENPLAYLQGQNVQTDLRHQRRALSENELKRLMAATATGQDHSGLTAKERVMLYAVAVSTGLRASELASLTWSSFDLGHFGPSVKVLVAYSKHRRDDVVPLRADLVRQLVAWRDESHPDVQARVFPCFNSNKAARMLRKDLGVAHTPYRDAAGRVADFHSLRHTFISNLTRGGVSPKVAQSLAKHGSIGLTMDT
jgi:integrase